MGGVLLSQEGTRTVATCRGIVTRHAEPFISSSESPEESPQNVKPGEKEQTPGANGEGTKKDEDLTRTKLAGNQPSLSRILPHHHSLLVASITSMTSPALNPSSWSSMVTWSQRASAYTTLPSLMSCGQSSHCQSLCACSTVCQPGCSPGTATADSEPPMSSEELVQGWQLLRLTLLSTAFIQNHLHTPHLLP